MRFIDPDWGYGKGAASGAMIGYLQTMPAEKTLKDVNGYAKKIEVPHIRRSDGNWAERGVTRLAQTLIRKLSPSPFRLLHLWVDLRHRYATNASAP